MRNLPVGASAQQLADYFTWMVETGRGAHLVQLDQRGLADLCKKGVVLLGIPPAGEHIADGTVFLRAVA